MKKIIHLSDLHLGTNKRIDAALTTIITNLRAFKEKASQYVIVVTGDLVNNANNKKHEMIKSYFDELKAVGFTIFVVPGNHDYGNGIRGKRKFVNIFKSIFFEDEELQYPKVDFVPDPYFPDNPDETIGFIGMDSMAEELGLLDHLFAEGELGESQLNRLDEILSRSDVLACGKRVLYMHHHPFDPTFLHQLKDSDKLKKVVAAHIQSGTTIDALLYGHNHEGQSHPGMWGIPRCYDGSSATGKVKHKLQPILQRVIDLKKDPETDYSGDFHIPKSLTV